MDKIKILIADGAPVVREGFSSMLSKHSDFAVIGETENGQETINEALKLKPDVILLNIKMPLIDSVEVMKRIKEQDQHIKFIVLTYYDNNGLISRAIEAGATSYLLKDSPKEDLFKAIRAAIKGDSLIQLTVPSNVLARFTRISQEIQNYSDFSSREIEVLVLMAKGFSNKDIAERLILSESTVKTHIHNIFHKLNVYSRTEAVTKAIRIGILNP
jgi:DNA-binding NarL/FixJ family response regulator